MRYWTDGACYPNPGSGGWAVVDENGEVIASGYEHDTTNNRMELIAVLMACQHSPKGGFVYSDSSYAVDCVMKWYVGWLKNGKTVGKKNLDVIEKCYELVRNKSLTLSWIRRDTHEMNQVADEASKFMAQQAYEEKNGISFPDNGWNFYSKWEK